MIRPILLWPDPYLKKKSLEVDLGVDLFYEDVVYDMYDTMHINSGVGLSAVQIGVALRIVTLDAGKGPEAWINPKIVLRSPEKELMPEGCLSLPGVTENVSRNVWVEVEGLDIGWHPQFTRATGLRAQVFQHELEHLDGRMYVDKMDPGFKDRLRKRLKKMGGHP